MNINKCSGVIAAMATLLCTGVSSAEDNFSTDSTTGSPFVCTGYRADLVEWVEEFARFSRCVDYPSNLLAGQWNPEDPVWQWRGTKGDGCEVHWKLSKLLDEENDSGGSKRKGKNANRGAAAELAHGRDFDAIDSLTEFVDTIEWNAKIRTDEHTLADGTVHTADNHQHFADDFVAEATDILGCVGELMD